MENITTRKEDTTNLEDFFKVGVEYDICLVLSTTILWSPIINCTLEIGTVSFFHYRACSNFIFKVAPVALGEATNLLPRPASIRAHVAKERV